MQVWVEGRLSEVSILAGGTGFSFGAELAEDTVGLLQAQGQDQFPSSHGGVTHRPLLTPEVLQAFQRQPVAAGGSSW